MDLGAILLTVAASILIGLFVARPFIQFRKNPGIQNSDHDRSALLANRERLIEAIQELDFDHTLGKIPAEDYPGMRSILVKKAALVIKDLDTLQSSGQSDQDIVTSLEFEVSKKRTDGLSTTSTPKPMVDDEDIEELIAARRAARKEKSAGFCPNCGKPILKSDKFCPSCGKTQK